MKKHVRWFGVMVLLALGIWFLAVGGDGSAADDKGGATLLPPAEAAKLIEQSAKIIQESLEKPDKKALSKARTAAVMAAVYAQCSGGGANVQAAALKLAEAIKANNLDEAKKLAKELGSMKPDKAKPGPVIVEKQIELDEVMHQFSLVKAGGQGIEQKLLKLGAMKKGIKVDEELALMAYQVSAVGALIKDHDPGKKKQAWQGIAEEMTKASIDLAKTKEGKAAVAAVNKVNASCNKCHESFRD